MKNGPGQARGERSPVLLARKSGQGRNARSRVMTGLLGPGPRGMAVCHAVARPTHDYKNPLLLSQVRAGGRVSPVSGKGGTLGRRARGPPSPRPHPPPNALFSGRWAGAVARQVARVSRAPRCSGRVGAAGKNAGKARRIPVPWAKDMGRGREGKDERGPQARCFWHADGRRRAGKEPSGSLWAVFEREEG